VLDPCQHHWIDLWERLAALQGLARRLRQLSQHEPLAQMRPGYPRAGPRRSHADEVREVLDGIRRRLDEVRALLPTVLPAGPAPSGIAADEAPGTLGARVDALIRLASGLAQEAFQPPPKLPPHAPPYLVEPPGHDLPGTKAALLALGIEVLSEAVQNAMLAGG
jgi:hypothetical protein